MTAGNRTTHLERMTRSAMFGAAAEYIVELPDAPRHEVGMTVSEIGERQLAAMQEGLYWSGVLVDIDKQLDEAQRSAPIPVPPECPPWCARDEHLHGRTGWDDDEDESFGGGVHFAKWCEMVIYAANPSGASGVSIRLVRDCYGQKGVDEIREGVALVEINGDAFAPSQARKIAQALRQAADIADGKPIPADLRPRFGGHSVGRLA